MSFGICSTYGVAFQPLINAQEVQENRIGVNRCNVCPDNGQKTLICYTPKGAEGTVSCLKKAGSVKSTMTTDSNLAMVPANAIIDSIEFFGTGAFSTKDEFSIGLGQLNQGLSFPLIEETNDEIANEKIGGCRQFLSYRPDGRTDKNVVLYASNVNVSFNQPVVSGGLTIVIRYHVKP